MKNQHTKATHKNIMVLTPTHSIKHYAAKPLVAYTMQAFPDGKHGAPIWWVVAANSKEFDWSPFLEANPDGLHCIHLEDLPEECYDCKGAIHRRIVHTMNQLRAYFLESNMQWCLSLESDVLLGIRHVEAMIRRVNENQLVCLHTNCYAGFNLAPVFAGTDRLTLGCTLIHRSILEQFEFRYEEDMLAAFHDALLIKDMREAGVPAHYDPHIKPIHLNNRKNDGRLRRGWENLPDSELEIKRIPMGGP